MAGQRARRTGSLHQIRCDVSEAHARSAETKRHTKVEKKTENNRREQRYIESMIAPYGPPAKRARRRANSSSTDVLSLSETLLRDGRLFCFATVALGKVENSSRVRVRKLLTYGVRAGEFSPMQTRRHPFLSREQGPASKRI